ncbi:hypothetical protein Pden_0071 [Paracoccus denitrificans PD1222]|uniref:Uncharacterized protein n=1 Tax=Paracoccus denitrificans (strain Pd 1222) TaxID=318586 RepID=A1AY44_PARDP|nr:hypothetical protein Pden_0071 [Paracoccus denitrificans PD1222]
MTHSSSQFDDGQRSRRRWPQQEKLQRPCSDRCQDRPGRVRCTRSGQAGPLPVCHAAKHMTSRRHESGIMIWPRNPRTTVRRTPLCVSPARH